MGKGQENGPVETQNKQKQDRAMEAGRRTKEEIVKWNQMTALKFQTGGWGGDIRHARPPFGVYETTTTVLIIIMYYFVCHSSNWSTLQ